MVEIEQFEIIPNVEPPIYNAGETIRGTVHLLLRRVFRLKNIFLNLKGHGYVEVPVFDPEKKYYKLKDQYRIVDHKKHCKSHDEDICYHEHSHDYTWISSEEDYIEHTKNLWDDESKRKLPAGNYNFTFSFDLPAEIPSSFEGHYGYIRYFIKCTIILINDNSISKDLKLKVNSGVHVNIGKHTQERIVKKDEAKIGWFQRFSQPLSVVLRLEKSEYIPGEMIFIDAEIKNKSLKKINISKAALLSIAKFHTPVENAVEVKEIASIMKGPIKAGADYLWDKIPLQIPLIVTPSELKFNNLISLDYEFQFSVDIIQLSQPITIGTGPPKRKAPVWLF